MVRPALPLLAATVALAFAHAPAGALDVTTCGQVVPKGQVGELVADLDCTKSIQLERRATLRLNGHTITGFNASPGVCFTDECGAVWCKGQRCRIEGPGILQGFAVGLFGRPDGNPLGKTKVIASNLTLQLNGVGINSERVNLTDVQLIDNLGLGIAAERQRLRNVEIRDNGGTGSVGISVRGTDVIIDGNGSSPTSSGGGVRVSRFSFRNLTATGNTGNGVEANVTGVLRDSVVTGNTDTDVSTARPPRLRNTTCDTSSDQAGGDWDVCALD